MFHGSTVVTGEPLVLTFDSPQDMIVDGGSLAEARTLVRTTTVDIAVGQPHKSSSWGEVE